MGIEPIQLTRTSLKRWREQETIKQSNLCLLCKCLLVPPDAVADHDHKTGLIRGVLCRNCNGMLGKVENAANRAKRKGSSLKWLENLVAYLKQVPATLLYPK